MRKKIFFRGSRTHTEMTIEEAKQLGRPFYFYDPDAGLCASTEDGHEPVAGHKVGDYTKDNPLSPRYQESKAEISKHSLFDPVSGERDYRFSNPLTPKKDGEDTAVDWRIRNPIVPEEDKASSRDYAKDNPLTPKKDKTGVKKSLLAP